MAKHIKCPMCGCLNFVKGNRHTYFDCLDCTYNLRFGFTMSSFHSQKYLLKSEIWDVEKDFNSPVLRLFLITEEEFKKGQKG